MSLKAKIYDCASASHPWRLFLHPFALHVRLISVKVQLQPWSLMACVSRPLISEPNGGSRNGWRVVQHYQVVVVSPLHLSRPIAILLLSSWGPISCNSYSCSGLVRTSMRRGLSEESPHSPWGCPSLICPNWSGMTIVLNSPLFRIWNGNCFAPSPGLKYGIRNGITFLLDWIADLEIICLMYRTTEWKYNPKIHSSRGIGFLSNSRWY